jgi:hypothetical protein
MQAGTCPPLWKQIRSQRLDGTLHQKSRVVWMDCNSATRSREKADHGLQQGCHPHRRADPTFVLRVAPHCSSSSCVRFNPHVDRGTQTVGFPRLAGPSGSNIGSGKGEGVPCRAISWSERVSASLHRLFRCKHHITGFKDPSSAVPRR